jgi:hypothetical protein
MLLVTLPCATGTGTGGLCPAVKGQVNASGLPLGSDDLLPDVGQQVATQRHINVTRFRR